MIGRSVVERSVLDITSTNSNPEDVLSVIDNDIGKIYKLAGAEWSYNRNEITLRFEELPSDKA